MLRRLRRLALLGAPPLLLAPVARSAHAQPAPGAVAGTVVDSAAAPVRTARVAVDDRPPIAVSADSARFAVPELAPGPHRLAVRAIGCAPQDTVITIAAGATLRLDVRLACGAQQLERAVVSAPAGAPSPQHRKNGSSTVITRAEIERRTPSRFGDLLRRLPGVALQPVTTEYGSDDYLYVMRGKATASGQPCPIAYFLDGHPAPLGAGGVDALVRPADLDSIEVYASGSQAPARFSTATSGRCGVIVLWTRAAR